MYLSISSVSVNHIKVYNGILDLYGGGGDLSFIE